MPVVDSQHLLFRILSKSVSIMRSFSPISWANHLQWIHRGPVMRIETGKSGNVRSIVTGSFVSPFGRVLGISR